MAKKPSKHDSKHAADDVPESPDADDSREPPVVEDVDEGGGRAGEDDAVTGDDRDAFRAPDWETVLLHRGLPDFDTPAVSHVPATAGKPVVLDNRWRSAQFVRADDGATVTFLLDLGYDLAIRRAFRLEHIDIPDVGDPDADERARAELARAFVVDWTARHAQHEDASVAEWPFTLHGSKVGPYGRYLIRVECLHGHCLNSDLVTTGLANPYPLSPDGDT